MGRLRRDRIQLPNTHLFDNSLHSSIATHYFGETFVIVTIHNSLTSFSGMQRAGYERISPHADRRELFDNFDLVVLSSRHEGLPIGLLALGRDADSIAALLLRVMTNPELPVPLCEALCQTFLASCKIERMASGHGRLCHELLAEY